MNNQRFCKLVFLVFYVFSCLINSTTSQIFPFVDVSEVEKSRIIPKIVGGVRAKRGQFPFQVIIYLHDQKHCGGVILDHYNILTAAHCVMRFGSKVDSKFFKIKAGHVYVSSPKIKQFNISSVHAHGNFNSTTYDNDIAILKLATPFPEWNRDFQPVELATKVVPDGTHCTVSGWGSRLLFAPGMPDYLYYTEVEIENLKKCRKLYKLYNKVTSNMICATFEDSPRDSCSGDSGGPLICKDKLSGLVSWGKGCALPKFPGVYVNIPAYLRWIDSVLNNNELLPEGKRRE